MSAVHIVFVYCLTSGEKSGHEVLGLSLLCQTDMGTGKLYTWLLEICFDLFPCFLMVYKDTCRESSHTNKVPW